MSIFKKIAMAVAISISALVSVAQTNAVSPLRHLAEEALRLSASEDIADRRKALDDMLEFIVRTQDWVVVHKTEDPDSPLSAGDMMTDDLKLFGEVVTHAVKLKSELEGGDTSSLTGWIAHTLMNSTTPDLHTFGNIPNIYPPLDDGTSLIAGDIPENIGHALSALRGNELQTCERILLALYDRTWLKAEQPEFRHLVANKMALFYLCLGLNDRAEGICRQNKIDMEGAGILDSDYLECLSYMAECLSSQGMKGVAKDYLALIERMGARIGCDTGRIKANLTSIASALSSTPSRMDDTGLYDFISFNDKSFAIFTEQERTERWESVAPSWRAHKSALLASGHASPNLDHILNAFQYEKTLKLRSYLKVEEAVRESGDTMALSLLKRINEDRRRMTASYLPDWKSVKAEYQMLQKELMHMPVMNGVAERLYEPVTTHHVAAWLSDDEVFVDFGIIHDGESDKILALAISRSCPQGQLVELCDKERLVSFIDSTETTSAQATASARYEDEGETLYDLLWHPLEETGLLRPSVLYSPADVMNLIMPEAIMHDGRYLAEDYSFHILSTLEALARNRPLQPAPMKTMVSFHAIDYVGDRRKLILNALSHGEKNISGIYDDDMMHNRSAFGIDNSILPLSTEENFNWLRMLTEQAGVELVSFTAEEASEYAFKNLSGRKVDIVNIHTHAFALPPEANALIYPYVMDKSVALSVQDRMADAMKGDLPPMSRTGLFFSGAERYWCGRNIISGMDDCILNAEELSVLDLRSVRLVTLMACATGRGQLDEFEGILGLRRALKSTGCRTLVTTAWNVDSEAVLAYMQSLYENIFRGMSIPEAHRDAQLRLMERFTSPYYWAPFQLID